MTALAIFHLSASTGSKASGQSAGAKASYIARAGKYRRDREELVHVESKNMPAWAARGLSERSDAAALEYWRAADVHERANGRLYKQVEFALPVELARGQQVALARYFARELTGNVDGGALPYTLAVHAGEQRKQQKNPHCHLIISERVNDGIAREAGTWFKRAAVAGKDQAAGGARKTEALKPKEWLEAVREKWARFANRALELAGFAERIDHRSLEAQQVERIPQIHLGPNVSKMMARGIDTDRAVAAKRVTISNEQIVKLRQEQAHDQRLMVAERQQSHVPGAGAPEAPAPARGAVRPPQRPIVEEQERDQRLVVSERQQSPVPQASGTRASLRDAPRPPRRPIADAFERKRQRVEVLARDMVRTGQWKKVDPAVVDYRVCIELIREGYAPAVVQGELLRLGREQEYAVRTIAQASEKARQLGKGLER